MERPNTVAGLEAKKHELTRLRDLLEMELRKVRCDLDHLEAAIALFDPANTPAAIKRYVVKHRAGRGAVRKFLLDTLKASDVGLTSAMLANMWLEQRGLRTDEQTYTVIRKRLGACLIALRNQRLVSSTEIGSGLKSWRLSEKD